MSLECGLGIVTDVGSGSCQEEEKRSGAVL